MTFQHCTMEKKKMTVDKEGIKFQGTHQRRGQGSTTIHR
jgi:hypothetical protein